MGPVTAWSGAVMGLSNCGRSAVMIARSRLLSGCRQQKAPLAGGEGGVERVFARSEGYKNRSLNTTDPEEAGLVDETVTDCKPLGAIVTYRYASSVLPAASVKVTTR